MMQVQDHGEADEAHPVGHHGHGTMSQVPSACEASVNQHQHGMVAGNDGRAHVTGTPKVRLHKYVQNQADATKRYRLMVP
jgi:hypothetical protein